MQVLCTRMTAKEGAPFAIYNHSLNDYIYRRLVIVITTITYQYTHAIPGIPMTIGRYTDVPIFYRIGIPTPDYRHTDEPYIDIPMSINRGIPTCVP